MVPSERSDKISHTSESVSAHEEDLSRPNLSSHIEGSALAKLTAMFADKEDTGESTRQMEVEPTPAIEPQTHLAEIALSEAAPAAEPVRELEAAPAPKSAEHAHPIAVTEVDAAPQAVAVEHTEKPKPQRPPRTHRPAHSRGLHDEILQLSKSLENERARRDAREAARKKKGPSPSDASAAIPMETQAVPPIEVEAKDVVAVPDTQANEKEVPAPGPGKAVELFRPQESIVKPPRHEPADDHHHDTQQPSKSHKERPRSREPIAIEPIAPVALVAEPTPETTTFDKKKQEELWGMRDKVKPEDVEEGAITAEEYLARRPAAQPGDVLRTKDKNGRTILYKAHSGHRVKEADYVKQGADSRARDAAFETIELHASEAVRENIEGKLAVEKDDRLRGLSLIGQELLNLRDSTSNRKFNTKEVNAKIAAKEAVFKDLFELYKERNLDGQGLAYLNDTFMETYEDVDHKAHKGSAWLDDEQVTIQDVIVSPAGDKAYTVVTAEGETKTVQASNIAFKQEFTEAPKEKETLFGKAKNFFKKFAADRREFGGKAAFSARWDNAKDWLFNRHITPEMSPEEAQGQKEVNRRNNIIGGTALFVTAAAAVGVGVLIGANIHEQLNADAVANLPTGGGNPAPEAAGSAALVDGMTPAELRAEAAASAAAEASAAADSLSQAIQNPNYNVPVGGKGLNMFAGLGLSADTWNQHAQELVQNFPTEFYNQDGDVRIMNPGWLSEDARKFIEGLRG